MPNDTVQLLQLTDCHVFSNPSANLLGFPCDQSYLDILEFITPDITACHALLVTGDISQNYTTESYEFFFENISRFNKPVYVTAGNHDERNKLKHVAAQYPLIHLSGTMLGKWRLLPVNTAIPGKVHGEVGDLNALESALEKNHTETQNHILLTMHHPPVKCGSQWLDGINCRNADAFWEVVQSFPEVKLVVCGHIHQALDVVQHKVRVIATPSTCIQFLPQSDDFALDAPHPGARKITLLPDGHIATSVKRLTDKGYPQDASQKGY